MRIIKRQTLVEFWERFSDAKPHLEAWFYEAKNSVWKTPAEVKEKYGNASILKNQRVVFNIKGNDYRLVVKIEYKIGIIFIRFLGTHSEYNNINAEKI